MKFDEKWERNGKSIEGTNLSSIDAAKFFPTSADNAVAGGSSVYKHLAGVEGDTWKDGGDGYFYYKTTLGKDQSTTQLMDYVTLCKDANMGEYTVSTMKYALVDESKKAEDLTDADYDLTDAPAEIPAGKVLYQKKVVELNKANAGLAGANYTLTITTELVQANADAAKGWTVTPTK